jgi:hypothetical protein
VPPLAPVDPLEALPPVELVAPVELFAPVAPLLLEWPVVPEVVPEVEELPVAAFPVVPEAELLLLVLVDPPQPAATSETVSRTRRSSADDMSG